MKIALVNSVILNGGDAGIAYGTLDAIHEVLPSAEVTVFSRFTREGTACYRDLNLSSMVNDRWPDHKNLARTLRMTFPLRSLTGLFLKRENDFFEELKSMNLIVYCGGGYLNDLYSNKILFSIINSTLGFGIPHMAYAHSIGPFFRQKSMKKASTLLNRFDAVTVRDQASLDLLKVMKIDSKKVSFTADAAFAMRPADANIPVADRNAMDNILKFKNCRDGAPLLFISVRDWHFPGCKEATFLKSHYRFELRKFIERVMRESIWRICFVSTCQGREGYGFDDAQFAESLIKDLYDVASDKILVCRHGFSPRSYPFVIGKCADFTVSMRMHFNIFSIMGGVPFIGIAYEKKSQELALQMGLAELCHDLKTLKGDDLFRTFRVAAEERAALRNAVEAGYKRLRERSLQNAKVLVSVLS